MVTLSPLQAQLFILKDPGIPTDQPEKGLKQTDAGTWEALHTEASLCPRPSILGLRCGQDVKQSCCADGLGA